MKKIKKMKSSKTSVAGHLMVASLTIVARRLGPRLVK